jgi:hypothetical protein
MPATLACRFTTGELAVVRDNGQCVLPIDAIAARAGVCRRTAQNALRQAAREGLLTVQERRREGRRNDYNVVRIISAEWLTWIKRHWVQKKSPHGYSALQTVEKRHAPQSRYRKTSGEISEHRGQKLNRTRPQW